MQAANDIKPTRTNLEPTENLATEVISVRAQDQILLFRMLNRLGEEAGAFVKWALGTHPSLVTTLNQNETDNISTLRFLKAISALVGTVVESLDNVMDGVVERAVTRWESYRVLQKAANSFQQDASNKVWSHIVHYMLLDSSLAIPILSRFEKFILDSQALVYLDPPPPLEGFSDTMQDRYRKLLNGDLSCVNREIQEQLNGDQGKAILMFVQTGIIRQIANSGVPSMIPLILEHLEGEVDANGQKKLTSLNNEAWKALRKIAGDRSVIHKVTEVVFGTDVFFQLGWAFALREKIQGFFGALHPREIVNCYFDEFFGAVGSGGFAVLTQQTPDVNNLKWSQSLHDMREHFYSTVVNALLHRSSPDYAFPRVNIFLDRALNKMELFIPPFITRAVLQFVYDSIKQGETDAYGMLFKNTCESHRRADIRELCCRIANGD